MLINKFYKIFLSRFKNIVYICTANQIKEIPSYTK